MSQSIFQSGAARDHWHKILTAQAEKARQFQTQQSDAMMAVRAEGSYIPEGQNVMARPKQQRSRWQEAEVQNQNGYGETFRKKVEAETTEGLDGRWPDLDPEEVALLRELDD